MAIRKSINSFIELFYFPFLRFMPLQTFKYAVCGGTTVVVEQIVYNLALYGLFCGDEVVHFAGMAFEPHTAAFLIGFAVSFPMGFVLNKYLVFTASSLRGRVQLFRYGLSVLGSFALNYFFLILFVEILHWDPSLSKFLATALVVVYSYFAQQYFSFGSQVKEEDSNMAKQ